MTSRVVLSALFALLLSVAAVPSHILAQERPAEDAAVTSPDATVFVDGMACPFCAYGIEKKLKNLDALQSMEVQLEEGRVLLVFKEGESATKDEIQKAVENAGFTARKIEFADETATEPSSS
jgi:mercuric ion binding protein